MHPECWLHYNHDSRQGYGSSGGCHWRGIDKGIAGKDIGNYPVHARKKEHANICIQED
jgi:hypothetical protein